MLGRRRKAGGLEGPHVRSRRGVYALGLASGLVLLTLIPVAIAQQARRAARARGRFKEANQADRDAAAAAPRDPAINTAWGDLFLEKYNNAEALKSYRAALQTDPAWAPAILGSARALDNDDPPQAVAA